MRQHDSISDKFTLCGEIYGKLSEILDVADRVIDRMGFYNLFNSNCQHFCNNFLNHYGLAVYPVTVGKNVTATLDEEPAVEERVHRLLAELAMGNPSAFRRGTAEIANYIVGAN